MNFRKIIVDIAIFAGSFLAGAYAAGGYTGRAVTLIALALVLMGFRAIFEKIGW